MYTITKDLYFCYGHRLMHHAGKCRHVHGHSVKAAITLQAEALDDQGMVLDFAELSEIASDFIASSLDHNLLLHRDDPLVPVLREAGERFLLLDEHPTAEYLARLIYEAVKARGLRIQGVTLWETASAAATYVESP